MNEVDREVLKLIAHIDQVRCEMRDRLRAMERQSKIDFFRACADARFDDMDDDAQTAAGLLAALGMLDLIRGDPSDSVD